MKARKITALLTALTTVTAMSGLFTFAADSVTGSISEETAKAGEKFTVNLDLSSVPANGIGVVDFAVKYDSSLVTISNVETGSLCDTGAESAEDSLFSGMGDTVFSWADDGSQVQVLWVTGLTDSNYWIKGTGTFVTISGTVKDSAKDGDVAKFEVVPTSRETYDGSGKANSTVAIGYCDANSKDVYYTANIASGSVKIGSGSQSKTLYGDVNVDGSVSTSDLVFANRAMKDEVVISAQGQINGDVDFDGNVAATDIAKIAKYLGSAITYEQLASK